VDRTSGSVYRRTPFTHRGPSKTKIQSKRVMLKEAINYRLLFVYLPSPKLGILFLSIQSLEAIQAFTKMTLCVVLQ